MSSSASWQSLLHNLSSTSLLPIVLLLYFSYSLYFCPHLQPCLLLVPMSHRLSNLSNPLSWPCSASWPRTAPPWGENRCSDTHSTEHTATCGIGWACTQQWANAHTQTQRYTCTYGCTWYAAIEGTKQVAFNYMTGKPTLTKYLTKYSLLSQQCSNKMHILLNTHFRWHILVTHTEMNTGLFGTHTDKHT